MTDLPTILIDTRERRPWPFAGYGVERVGLRTGDYSLAGHTDPPDGVAIERKSAADLVACITWERDRFVRELERLAEFRLAFVVVDDSDLLGILDASKYGKSKPRARLASIVAWTYRYPSVHWLFIAGRWQAERVVLRIFERYVAELEPALVGAS
ncbi:MAG: hypothetical protein JXA69_14930 [Phycisphaerae bacterium]|nr:hypothetical protein [Phycisphaerae bacterium]